MKKIKLTHRQLLNLSALNKRQVDHINHNGLDNRRENLRICTVSQNCQNSKANGKTSKYKGVYWDKSIQRFKSKIRVNGKNLYVGSSINEVEVAKLYNKAAIKYFGKYAYLNEVK